MNPLYHFYNTLWNLDWCRRRFGKSVYKRMSALGPAPDVPFETDFFGLRYAGNLRNTIDFAVYYHGAFEKPLLFFMRDCLLQLQRDHTVYCDVGANIGQHAMFMSMYADQVHAFEPYDKVRNQLLAQITLNRLGNIQVHCVGLGEADANLPFFAPAGRNQGIGSFDASTVEKGNQPIGSLQLVNGDEYFAGHGISRVDLIKVDVEGFEKPALKGLKATLQRCRPVLICELTYGKPFSFASVTELLDLLPADYTLLTFSTRKADGSKARRRGAKAKRSGSYQLVPYGGMLASGQDDIVAVPSELLERIPRTSP